MPRGDLFPDIAPYETGLLPLSGGHVMYWEQVGNPRGQPVLFIVVWAQLRYLRRLEGA